jgi:DNA-binding MarR family transcriptional regulator
MTGREVLVLERYLPYRFLALSQKVSRYLQNMYETEFGLTQPAWRVMTVLGRFAPMRAKDVAELSGMEQVKITRAVATLAKAGFVSRRVDPKDRRQVSLALSAKGEAAYQELVPFAHAMEDLLVEDLSDVERRQLGAILDKLEARADALMNDPDTLAAISGEPRRGRSAA